MSEYQSSQENSSVLLSQEDQSKKQDRLAGAENRNKESSKSLIEQTSNREERKFKQCLQRIQEQERQQEVSCHQFQRYKGCYSQEKAFESITAIYKSQTRQQSLQTLMIHNRRSSRMKESKQFTQKSVSVAQLVLLNPQLLPQESQAETRTQAKLRFNPKLKMKEKHHIYLYLSDCFDKCAENIQKVNSTATQLYSPQRIIKQETTSLISINQDVYQETLLLNRNLKHQFQSSNNSVQRLNSNEQREFINKYLDNKYLESVMRDSRLQIYKKSMIDKMGNGKTIPKKY